MTKKIVLSIYKILRKHSIFKSSKLITSFLSQYKKFKLSPDIDNSFGTSIRLLMNWFEIGTVKIAKTFIKPGMNVVDIGAETGYFTRLFSQITGKSGKIWAFEPHPGNFEILCKNISHLKYKNVIPIQKAVSNKNDEAILFEMTGAGKHSLYNISQHLNHFILRKKIKTQTIIIDEYLKQYNNPIIDFIKIDIEGAEPLAIKGMRQTIERSPNLVLVTEFNRGTLEAAGQNIQGYLDQLKGLGFNIFIINDATQKIKTLTLEILNMPIDAYVNLLCLKTHPQKNY